MVGPTEDFWNRDVNDILETPRDILKDHVNGYYAMALSGELDQIRKLVAATEHAERLIGEVNYDLLEARIDRLEKMSSTSYFEAALGLALGGLGGVVAAGILKSVLGRILRSRLLLVTTVSKVRLPMDAATPKNLAKLRALAESHSRKLTTKKHFYKLTGPAEEINLNPRSWESFLLEHAPGIISGAAIEARGEVMGLDRAPSSGSTVLFFQRRKSELQGQIFPIEAAYDTLMKSRSFALSSSSNTEADETARRDIVETIQDNRAFLESNTLAQDRGSRADEELILAQPIFAAAVAMSFFVPVEILAASPAKTVSFPSGGFKPGRSFYTVPAKPTRPHANPAEMDLLLRLSKTLYVPEMLERHQIVSMFDHYRYEVHRPELEVVKYFNTQQLASIAPRLESMAEYLRVVAAGISEALVPGGR